MNRACAGASAIAAARAPNVENFRAFARREPARVHGEPKPLLFDIVNVQNWTALVQPPPFWEAQRKRRPFVNFRGAAALWPLKH